MAADFEQQIRRLQRRVDRERTARLEAEAIAEKATRRLYGMVTELRRANEDVEDFAYVASHDLRAPLRAIDNLSAWIQEDMDDVLSNQSREHLTLLRGRVQRMDSLLNGLLTYARVGRSQVSVEAVDVAEMVTEVEEMLSLPEGFVLAVADDLPAFETARIPLEQVLLNLVSNAVKHHDSPNGRIEIGCRDLGQFYEFCVSDDGPGIPTQYHEKVFQLFQTIRPRDELEGAGMGLALVQKHVQLCGGTLALESGEGRGATFRFTWPKSWSSRGT